MARENQQQFQCYGVGPASCLSTVEAEMCPPLLQISTKFGVHDRLGAVTSQGVRKVHIFLYSHEQSKWRKGGKKNLQPVTGLFGSKGHSGSVSVTIETRHNAIRDHSRSWKHCCWWSTDFQSKSWSENGASRDRGRSESAPWRQRAQGFSDEKWRRRRTESVSTSASLLHFQSHNFLLTRYQLKCEIKQSIYIYMK